MNNEEFIELLKTQLKYLQGKIEFCDQDIDKNKGNIQKLRIDSIDPFEYGSLVKYNTFIKENNFQNPEENILNSLEKVLLEKYPFTRFSLNGYQEYSVCLEKDAENWIVYNAERGNKYDLINCNSLYEASFLIIKLLTYDKEEQMMIVDEFMRQLLENQKGAVIVKKK